MSISRRQSNILAISATGSVLALSAGIGLHYATQNKLRKTIILNAQKYLGIKEVKAKPEDDDKGFTDKTFEYKLRHVGWQAGWDWCAFFVKLVLLESFAQMNLSEQYYFVKKYFTGRTQETWANFRQNRRRFFELSATPSKGSIAMWRNIYNRYAGHTGIVIQAGKDTFKTIEGNRKNDVGYMDRLLSAYTQPQGKLQLLGFIKFKI